MISDTRFKLLMVATEAVPFAKEGGVADVIGSLPRELAKLGHEVRIFMPRYGSVDAARLGIEPAGFVGSWQGRPVTVLRTTLPGSPVVVYLLDQEEFFGRHQRIYLGLDQRDEQRRFIF